MIKTKLVRLIKQRKSNCVPIQQCVSPNWKKFMEGRRGFEKTRWLNSPNVYQKVEVLETGTPDPKKITKVEVITIQSAS